MTEAGLPNIYGNFEANDLNDDCTPTTSNGALYHYLTRHRDAKDSTCNRRGQL